MIRKAAAILISFVLLLSAVACNRNEDIDPVASTSEAQSESADAAINNAPADYQTVVIATGALSDGLTPLFAETEGDLRIEDLTQAKLLDYDSFGAPDWDNSIATFQINKNQEEGTTAVTATIKDGIVFADSTEMTADDIIFTYYIISDASYHGIYRSAISILHGLSGYRVNNTGADSVTITDSLVKQSMKDDADVMLAISDTIIRPVLEKERVWCEDNWSSYAGRGYGKSPEDFFISLYILPLMVDYDASGKDFDRIVEDAIEIYGADYVSLGMYYRGSSTYFEDDALVVARKKLEEKLYSMYGGVQTDVISGVEKLDSRTVRLTFDSLDVAEVENALAVPIVSLKHYGNKSYNYDMSFFGVTRGDVSSVSSKNDSFGAGRYLYRRSDEATATLVRNERYFKASKKDPYELVLWYMGSTATKAALMVGTLDAGTFRYDWLDEAVDMTSVCRNYGIQIQSYGKGFCSVLGIDSSAVKVGSNQDSEASKALRKALLTVFDLNREIYRNDLGYNYTVSTINSIDSDGSWVNDIVTTDPYPSAEEGQNLSGMEFSDMEELAASKAKELLEAAGYVYDDGEEEFTAAPQGAKLSYSITVNPTVNNRELVIAVLEQGAKLLRNLGIRINIQAPESIGEYDELMNGDRELWVNWYQLDARPDVIKLFSQSGDGGLYGNERSDIEILCKQFDQEFNIAAAKEIYGKIYTSIYDYGMLLPLFESNNGIGIRTDDSFEASRWLDTIDVTGIIGNVDLG